MLTQLIRIINRSKGPLEISRLCGELGVDRPTLEGMLTTLRQMGYIRQDRIQKTEETYQTACTACSLHGGCSACGQHSPESSGAARNT